MTYFTPIADVTAPVPASWNGRVTTMRVLMSDASQTLKQCAAGQLLRINGITYRLLGFMRNGDYIEFTLAEENTL